MVSSIRAVSSAMLVFVVLKSSSDRWPSILDLMVRRFSARCSSSPRVNALASSAICSLRRFATNADPIAFLQMCDTRAKCDHGSPRYLRGKRHNDRKRRLPYRRDGVSVCHLVPDRGNAFVRPQRTQYSAAPYREGPIDSRTAFVENHGSLRRAALGFP